MDSLPTPPPVTTSRPPDSGDGPHAPPEAEITTSALLRELAASWQGERVSIAELIHGFGARGYGLLLFIFALPNMIPNPFPGVSSLLGLPLLLLAWQMARGLPEPYLPRRIAERSLPTAQLRSIAERAAPWIARVERWIRPRPGWVTASGGERMIGWASLVLSVPVLLPGPGTNGPPSWAIGLMAIGFLQRDRLMIYAGLAWGAIAMAIGIGGLYVGWMITVYLATKGWAFLGGLF
jgi:hypothetical protein